MSEPIIRQYIAPGGIGWVLALLVLVVAVVLAVTKGVNTELIFIGMLAAARLL